MATVLKRFRLPLTILSLIGLSAGMVGCGSSNTSNSSGNSSGSSGSKTFTLGAMLPTSGPSATLGQSMVNGANLAIDQINANGGIGGVKLKMVVEDNPGTPQNNVQNIQKLINVDHVQFSLTGMTSATLAVAPIADKNHVVLVNGGATGQALRGYPYLYSDLALGNIQVKAMLNYAYNTLGIRKLALIYGSDAQGQDFLKSVKKDWPALGGTLVGQVEVNTTATDFSSQVTKIKSMHPDGVFLGFFGTGQGTVLKDAQQQGLNTKWIGSSSLDNTGALKIAGSAANGAYDIEQPLDSNNSLAQSFISDYTSKYGSAPDTFANTYYTAVEVLGDVLKKLQSSGQKLTGQNIKMQLLKGQYKTIFGPMKFNADGSTSEAISIGKYDGSKFQIIKTFSVQDLASMK